MFEMKITIIIYSSIEAFYLIKRHYCCKRKITFNIIITTIHDNYIVKVTIIICEIIKNLILIKELLIILFV